MRGGEEEPGRGRGGGRSGLCRIILVRFVGKTLANQYCKVPPRMTSTGPSTSGIHPALASALARQGYETLTPVQTAVLEAGAAGRDLLVSAQTGSGKTVAFGLAIAPTLLGSDENQLLGPPDRPVGLIIAPTRELALQVERELAWLYADAGAVMASCVGGMDMRKERRQLERGAHIVVGTPGRLRDHITKGSLDLSGIKAVVLDEADEMLDLGFREDLEFILGAAPPERRTLMFSATVPKLIAQLAKTFQRDALRIVATAASERHADIDYQMVVTLPHERENAIINTLLYFDSGSAIVFCHTREAVKHLTARLGNRGFGVVSLSGELSQAERTNALQAMRDGRSRVCVATDVAARGIDLPNLDLVIHADMPANPDILLHRSGRTGRAGRKGTCVVIVPVRRSAAAARVMERANVAVSMRSAPTAAEIDQRYRDQILAAASNSPVPEEAEAGFVRELLARVSPEQLAAAYLRQQLQMRPAPEDISEVAGQARGSTPRTPDLSGPRPRAERPDMTGSTWFTLSLGRRHRAEPKWLLPMICKAGNITRDDVGSIKIFDEETRFEISAAKSAAYAETVLKNGSGEAGVTIAPAGSAPRLPRAEGPAPEKTFKHKGKPKSPGSFKGAKGGPKDFKKRKGPAKKA
jgi:ATP-dependent RNA helicase DeaD